MKLSKSTTILLNILLVLVIAVLVKYFLAFPISLHAKNNVEYKVLKKIDLYPTYRDPEEPFSPEKVLESGINKYANEGWRLHSYILEPELIIFER